MLKLVLTLAAVTISTLPESAQAVQPYAGLERRPIKALSDQQIADLKAGRGMGLALPAELNGYPGPSHVLELADKLNLSAAQIATVRALIKQMKDEAIPLGEQLIQQEAELERQFASGSVTSATLGATISDIGSKNAHLRMAHLKHHLTTLNLLTSDQAKQYAVLRGYATEASPHDHHRN